MLIHAATDKEIHPPLFGGSQRAFGLYRGLARRHEVTAMCVVPNRSTGAADERVAGLRLLRRRAWYTSVAWRLEQARLAPLLTAAYGHRLAAGALARAFPGPADAVLADLFLAGLLDADPAPLKVYTSHNVEVDHFRMTGADVLAPAFWTARLRALEGRAVRRATLTTVCSEEDAARMRELYGVPEAALAVIPNGYDETAVEAPDAAARERARVALGLDEREYAALFVGSDHPHNRAALAWIMDRVMPALAEDGFRLLVAGAVTRSLTGRREPWLVARPEMPDLSPLLHAADAGLNPVTTGGGSNVKLPTYLAAGLAVVTTPFGLRGYASLRPHVEVATLEEMTEALRERPAGWRARGLRLPDAVGEFAWGTLGEKLGEALEACREAPRRGTIRNQEVAGRTGA